MIVPSMSYKEIYDALETDATKLKIRREKILPKAIKSFKNFGNYPAWYVDEYTIPATNNQYILFYFSTDGREAEVNSFCVVHGESARYIVKGLKTGYNHTKDSEMIMLPQIHVYTNHFFQRYNERYLHNPDLSPNEVAGLFFVKNPKFVPIMLDENINKNYKRYGEYNDRGMLVFNGFCFTQVAVQGKESNDGIREHDKVDAMIVKYMTFLNKSDMTDTQRKAIEEGRIKTWLQCLEAFGEKEILNKMQL